MNKLSKLFLLPVLLVLLVMLYPLAGMTQISNPPVSAPNRGELEARLFGAGLPAQPGTPAPLANTRAYLAMGGNGLEIRTDAQGYFRVTGIPAGNYKYYIFTADRLVIGETIISGGQVTRLGDVVLKKTPIPMPGGKCTISVTAHGYKGMNDQHEYVVANVYGITWETVQGPPYHEHKDFSGTSNTGDATFRNILVPAKGSYQYKCTIEYWVKYYHPESRELKTEKKRSISRVINIKPEMAGRDHSGSAELRSYEIPSSSY